MKYLPLIWAGLWRKPLRSILTLASVVVAFLLFGVLMGVSSGFDTLVERARDDRLFTFSRYGGALPAAMVEQIANMDNMAVVAPTAGIGGYYQDPSNRVEVIGCDERLLQSWPELGVSTEQFAALQRVRTGVIVSRKVAERYVWQVGDRIPMEAPNFVKDDGSSNWTFDIVDVVEDNHFFANGFILGNFAYLDESRLEDKGTVNYIISLVDDPANADAAALQIDRAFFSSAAPVRTVTEKATAQGNVQGLVDMRFLSYAVAGAAMFMLLFLTGNVMAQSVRERLSEFAVLKTLGFSDLQIVCFVVAEASFLCLAGAGLGLLLARELVANYHRFMPQTIGIPLTSPTGMIVVYALIAALLVALASAWPPAARIKRLSVAAALRGR
jgi:putative ABC transport system permease protein